MKPAPRFPRSYENVPVRKALDALSENPTLEGLAELMVSATKGGLVIDVTGSDPSDTRVRTIESTTGELVLPLFTSITEVKRAVSAASPDALVQATIIPARDALALVETAEFVAVQFNPGSPSAMVVARSHVDTALHA